MKMTTCSSIMFFIYLSVVLHLSQGFEVIQPRYRTVNPDRSASITCEHTAPVSSVEDVQLNSISPTDRNPQLLCQKGLKSCKNIVMYEENPNKYIFMIFNIGPEEMKKQYQCKFTVNINDLHVDGRGTQPTLLEVKYKQEVTSMGPKKEAESKTEPQTESSDWTLLEFLLIGLLVLTLLYSCVITSFYFRLSRKSNTIRPENSTYMVMRKAAVPRNPEYDVYRQVSSAPPVASY